MDERMKFVGECLRGELSMAELCRFYGVSRKTGYKYVGRYLSEGPSGLEDRSRAPHHHPNAIDARRELAILALQAKHPTWGAKKLKAWLEKYRRQQEWPARSTITEMLDRAWSGAAAKAAPPRFGPALAADGGRAGEPGLGDRLQRVVPGHSWARL